MMPEERVITAFASQCNPRSQREQYPPLTQEERNAIIQEITDSCLEGQVVGRLYKAPDAYLCMALVTAWSMQACMRTTGRVPGERIRPVAYPVD